jgi:hypothetical protein
LKSAITHGSVFSTKFYWIGTEPVSAVPEQVAPLVGDEFSKPPFVRYVAICRPIVVPEYNAGITEALTLINALAAIDAPFTVTRPTPLLIVIIVLSGLG